MSENKMAAKDNIVLNFIKTKSTVMAFIILFIAATFIGWPNFLKPENLINIMRQISYTGIIALGMTLIIISGGIDLSVGSMTAFVAGISIYFMNLFGSDSVIALILVIVFAMVLGAACGLVNGLLVTKARIAPFIATLGMLSIFRSLIIYFSGASNIESYNLYYPEIGSSVFILPVPVWVFLIAAIKLHIFLKHTKYGRYICAVGDNEKVAQYSAINVTLVKIIPYVITGITVGLTAILWSSRLNSINSNDAVGYELDAIAAVVIGGTVMTGGKGSVLYTVLGAIMLGIINNMLVLGGISSYLQQATKGFVIIIAVFLQYNNNKN